MTSAVRLGPQDLDRALEVVAEASSSDGAQPFSRPVIERLHALIPAERAGYVEYRRPEFDIYKVEEPFVDIWTSDEIRALVNWWPLRDHGACNSIGHAVKLSDRWTRRQRLRNPWYVDVMQPRSAEHELKLWLPAPDGITRCFWLERGPDSRDFDERDRAVLTVLRPHLAAVRERWERRHRPAFGLTRREIEILQLVQQGLTNREIAAQLVISAGTVRSHLENIFGKLNVHTRTAALTRAFGITG